MSIPVKNAEGATFQLAMLTAPDGSQVQCIALVGADGQPITAWPLPAGAATDGKLGEIIAKLSADPATQTTLAAILAKLSADPATQTTLAQVLAKLPAAPALEAGNLATLAGKDFATQATLAQVLAALQATLTVAVQSFPADYPDATSLAKLEQIRAILAAPLSVTGPLTEQQLRATPIPNSNVDDSFLVRWVLKPLSRLTFTTLGLRVDAGGSSVSASIAANQDLRNVMGLWYNTQLGQAMQQSNHAFQNGFRRNLVVSP